MNVIFATNVYVSALALPKGSAAKALDRIVTEEHELFLSKPILDELLGVLARKFARDREELARVALFLSELATIVRPKRRLSVLDDEADNSSGNSEARARNSRQNSGQPGTSTVTFPRFCVA